MKKTIHALIILAFFSSCIEVIAQTDTVAVTLDQCIINALNFNPSIKEAVNELKAATFAVKIAGSGLYPVVSTDISGGFSNEYKLNNNYNTGDFTLSADQVLWQKGKINANIKQARYNQQAESFSLEAQKQDIIVLVKTAYFNCLLQSQLYKMAIGNVTNAGLFLEYAQERYKIGAGRKSDVLKAGNDLSEAEYERDAFRNSITRAQNELSMLTALTPEKLSRLENTLKYNRLDDYNGQLDSLRSAALSNYPELKRVNDLELAQQAKISQVKAELYPRLGFNAGYNWNYNPVLQEQKGWFTLMTLRWQLFTGNERNYQIKTEIIRKNIFENRKEEVKNFLQKEISNRLINIKEAESQIRLTYRMIVTTTENLEIAKAQYTSGTGSMLELTEARIDDLTARQKNIEAITAYKFALVNLERLTGNNNQY
jgi:outer membrane protein